MAENLLIFYLLIWSFVQCLQLNIALYDVQANLGRKLGNIKRLVLFSIPGPTRFIALSCLSVDK